MKKYQRNQARKYEPQSSHFVFVFAGAGLGGLIWGQLIGTWGWSYPALYRLGGTASIALSLLMVLNYHTWGKRNEKVVAERLERSQVVMAVTETSVPWPERQQEQGKHRF